MDTVNFLPHRLNRQPVVVRGLTANELWITMALSAVVGALIGMVLAIALGKVSVAPTVMALAVVAGVFLGGGLLRRLKRGRPDTWVYRQLQWWICCRLPLLAGFVGANALIHRSGHWTTRRLKSVRLSEAP
jgi:conjugative transfer region protein (TIGR03750 family)